MQQQLCTLKELPKVIKENRNNNIANIALWVFKYQKFNTRVALEHGPEGYSEQTLQNYFNYGIRFLKDGTRKGTYSGLYTNLDQLIKNHTQPLTPSFKDARRVTKRDYTRKDNPPPVAQMKICQKPLVAKCQYGIQTETTIRLCISEDYAMGYLDALRESGDEISKIVTVEIGEP